MRLTTKGRFAVTAMVDLGLRHTRGPVTLAGISERQDISLSYLEQLFGRLRRADDADDRREYAHRRAARLLEFLPFAEQAVVAGAVGLAQVEHAHLPVEAHAVEVEGLPLEPVRAVEGHDGGGGARCGGGRRRRVRVERQDGEEAQEGDGDNERAHWEVLLWGG